MGFGGIARHRDVYCEYGGRSFDNTLENSVSARLLRVSGSNSEWWMLAGKVAGRKAAWLADCASCYFLSSEEMVNGRE